MTPMRITIAFDLEGGKASNWSIDGDGGDLDMERGLAAMILLRKMSEIQIRAMHDEGLLSGDAAEMLGSIDRIGADRWGI